jgi:glycosyltransferase involved in cell wall biosynthesis
MSVDRPAVLFLLKGYPRLSETFIAQEIRSLEKRGLDIRIQAMRHPTDARVHPVNREIAAPVGYLPEYLHHEPLRTLNGLARALALPGFWRAAAALARDFARDRTRNRVRRFGQAAVLAAEIAPDVGHLHAHFIHTPASVVRYCAMLTGLPWTISAHAKDIWTSPDWDLAEKLAGAQWTVTCTATGRERLAGLAPDPARVHLVYHGLDLARFRALTLPRPLRDGTDAAHPVDILTVARAVEKKGLDVLIEALSQLPAGLHWRWTHIGGGELTSALKAQAAASGIGARCAFLGGRDQAEVLARYQASDLFVLPCRIADDGDRDGLPNVLVEASSQGLACVSTPVGGVAELITDQVNGRLCPPDDALALSAVLAELIAAPAERYRLGKAALARVRASFDHETTIGALHALFRPGHPALPASAVPAEAG